MPDFLLEPDEIEPERPERRRPVRLVSTGLAPTADVPTGVRRGTERVPCYAPCEGCGVRVLTGRTPVGVRLALDAQRITYAIDWRTGAPEPIFHESRSYPVHNCELVPPVEVPNA